MLPILSFGRLRRDTAAPVPLAEHVAAVHALREVLDEALCSYRSAIQCIARYAWGPADLVESHRRHLALLGAMLVPNPSKAHLIEVRDRLEQELRAFHARLPPPGAGDTASPARLLGPPPEALRAAVAARWHRAVRFSVVLLELVPPSATRAGIGEDAWQDALLEALLRLRASLAPADFLCRWADSFTLVLDVPEREAGPVAESLARTLTGVYGAGESAVTLACIPRVWEPARDLSLGAVLERLAEPYFFSPIQTGLDHAVSPSISVSRT